MRGWSSLFAISLSPPLHPFHPSLVKEKDHLCIVTQTLRPTFLNATHARASQRHNEHKTTNAIFPPHCHPSLYLMLAMSGGVACCSRNPFCFSNALLSPLRG